MRLCPNCSQEVSDDRKICRNCGSILETSANDEVAAPSTPGEPPQREDTNATAAEVTPADGPPTEEYLNGQIMPEASQSGGEKLWKCVRCGEKVPDTFAVCWNCQAPRIAQQTESTGRETPSSPTDSATDDLVVEATLVSDDHTPASATSKSCQRCGSTKMMYGVRIRDQGQGSDGLLKAVITGNPSALMFKDRCYGKLRADICGECGHVELRVTNSAELYRHYLKSHKTES